MSKRTRLYAAVAAATCVSLSIGVTTVAAHTATFPTEIDEGGASQSSSPGFFKYSIDGVLESQRAECLSNRTIEFYFQDGGSNTLKDVDKSSRNGFWAVGGESTEKPDSFLIKLIRKRLESPSGHRHVCSGDRLITFPIF